MHWPGGENRVSSSSFQPSGFVSIGQVVGKIVPMAACSLPSRGAAVSKYPRKLIFVCEDTEINRTKVLN